MEELVVLVADRQMEFAIRGLLERHHALEIRQITPTIYRHPNHDPGCRMEADSFLRQFSSNFHHALVLFDREGCGRMDQSAEELEQDVTGRLQRTGWQDRAGCIVLDPEMEIWVWSDSPEVNNCLGWSSRSITVQDWLKNQGLWIQNASKPAAPKEALELALREVGIPRSASLFRDLAQRVSVNRCIDPAFIRLRHILRTWFPSN
jgi:hypothetical protein